MLDAKPSSAGLFLLVVSVSAAGCGEPQCPSGYSRKGDTCYRPRDSGMTEAGDAGDEALDASEVELEDSSSSATAGDAAIDAPGVEPDGEGEPDPNPARDGTIDRCQGSGGDAVCDGAAMHHCSSGGETESVENCASPQQCQLGIAGDRCAPCSPGRFQCKEARLERCANDGSGWELFMTCDSAALCNATAGACTDKACTPTTRVCEGDLLRGCNTSQTDLVTIQTCEPGLCDQAGKQCDVCVADARSCSNDVRLVCDGMGQNLTRMPCAAPTPRCVGSAQCVQCTSASDCGTPDNACLAPACSAGGSCSTTNKAARTPCSGGVCNGSGSCVRCVDNQECAGVSGKPICSNGQCVQCTAAGGCNGPNQLCENNVCVTQPFCGDGIWTSTIEQCDYSARPRWDRFTCDENCRRRNLYNTCTYDGAGNNNNCDTACGMGYCWYACNGSSLCPVPPAGSNLQTFCWQNQACVLTNCASDADCPVGIPCQALSGGTMACWGCTADAQCGSGRTCRRLAGKTSGTCE